ncbi:MAG: RDD family protein [Labedaea sp.]
MSELVTGEAVVLDLRLARLASRGLAFALDVLVELAAMLLFVLLLTSGTAGLDDALISSLALVGGVAVLVGYPVLFETLSRGRTLGKLAFGLRVVRDDGGPIQFRHALVRGLTGLFVDFWVLAGSVAVFVSLASTKGKRVGDYLAGTVVVMDRIPGRETAAPPMPPGLAGWAAGLNVTAVPDALALAVRQFLSRSATLEPGARQALGARLAVEVSGYLGVPLPLDAWTTTYLAAVLAERRAREQARLTGPVGPAAPAGPPQSWSRPTSLPAPHAAVPGDGPRGEGFTPPG